MDEPREAWEWRVFVEHESHLPAFDKSGAPEERSEYDVYLLAPGSIHNVKLRDGDLEVKRLVREGSSGMQLWQNKETIPFPLSDTQVSLVVGLLGIQDLPQGVSKPEELIKLLRQHCRDLRTVAVWKQRYRWVLPDGCRVEKSHLTYPSGGRCWSLCVDGYDSAALQRTVERMQVPEGALVFGYVEMLHALVRSAREGERAPWATRLHSLPPS